MHFGRLDAIDGLSLCLYPDAKRTEKFLALVREGQLSGQSGETEILIGCPIWASRNWTSRLYPRGTKPIDFLKIYSSRFRTVEVNSTFYQLLDQTRIALWRDQATPGFRFCPKVFRGITEDLASRQLPSLIQTFCHSILAFGDKLGLAFAQFPETFGPTQQPLLKNFLSCWPIEIPLAIELRHPDWFHDHALLDETVNLLYRHRAATVITDTPGRRDVLHFSLTQPKVLIRFQGNSGHPTDAERITEWAERMRKWREASLKEIYFFAHQPEDETIPETAFLALKKILGESTPDISRGPDQLEIAGI